MKKILVVGAGGQIGSELVPYARKIYGNANVVAADFNESKCKILAESGPFEKLDALDGKAFHEIVKKHKIDAIYNLVALLSATGEKDPAFAWKVNMGALENSLEIARQEGCAVFTPSSIGAFGPSTPADNTPQDTIMQPTTIYGVCKVSGELWSNYYHSRFGVDTRSVRFPGIISNVTLPGGGTTDYAVEIFYEAIKKQQYTCNLAKGTFLDMMYMPDALKACIDLMEADPTKLIHRNSFNVTAMSFDPEIIATEIHKHIPEFRMDYKVDEVKQRIANSWPNSLDDRCAKEEWGWKPTYNLAAMTLDMLEKVQEKLDKGLI
ncbi:MAG: L-threonine 3-dehydrogenase [Salinivirgaceae bacterium]|nr:L-threonine 3-dehydrogenase [Salinivirgaceae bacterium]MDD4746749.1 L-threonine 3-dehydrogenase [Salinivirgaceae bacterium]MDY0281483.1 L-threonine 3-dehydrogenase [Salinivirgaceae bacterium]